MGFLCLTEATRSTSHGGAFASERLSAPPSPASPPPPSPHTRCGPHIGASLASMHGGERGDSAGGENVSSSPSTDNAGGSQRVKESPKYPRWNDTEYRQWKEKEQEILRDIEPILLLTKDILHSKMYMDGERLNAEDEKAVVEELLAYHPHAEDKIGCGLDSIMVDRHPQFRNSRCLFIIRTDGAWIDFSYQKCIRQYLREKYPSHAERFIREHFKRGSG